jgi:hypothetical protein
VKPKFTHDCETCTFLGHFYDHDVYLCGNQSIIARHGDDGGDYYSMPQSIFADQFANENWAEDQHMRAMAAGLCCHKTGKMPRQDDRFEDIREVKNIVGSLKMKMIFTDFLPGPEWGLEADTAFQHYYIARSLLEQAEHHLAIADAHDRECWKKYREKREAQEAENAKS